VKCPGGWIPVRYPPIKTKNGRLLPGDICAAFHPHLEAQMGPGAYQALLEDLSQPPVIIPEYSAPTATSCPVYIPGRIGP
jgi:hypothetical protein